VSVVDSREVVSVTKLCSDWKLNIRARYPLIYLVSSETKRVQMLLTMIAKEMNKSLYFWTYSRGLYDALSGEAVADTKSADSALRALSKLAAKTEALIVFNDLHLVLSLYGESFIETLALLKEAVDALSTTASSLFILAATYKIPKELEELATVIDVPRPCPDELEEMLAELEAAHGDRATFALSPEDQRAMVSALTGLTHTEVENVLAKALISDGRLDVDDLEMVIAEKAQIVRRSGVLEFIAVKEDISAIGGLDALKDWLGKKRRSFFNRMGASAADRPKGVLLVGVPGCGKSLMAKAVASAWRLPLVRLDIGKLYGPYYGESEQNLRTAIATVEAVAPCILWIDEIEKGFGGERKGGTETRIFGTFITWLNEKLAPVFIVATANDVSQLPPELLRKGRFDETFFVDLPNKDERADIVTKQLKGRGASLDGINVQIVAIATPCFSGSDLEGVVKDALELAWLDGDRAVVQSDLIRVAQSTVPLSVMMREKIDTLRAWAATRARPASETKETVRVPDEAAFASRRRLEF
jgi:SpoVK/Ycf46/Vps4 family AAA+-type ATPase